jgi:hypothetical protein
MTHNLKVGSRVRLVKEVDNYPTILAPVGLTGTIKSIENDCYWITLDKHFDALNEWDNALQIWDFEEPEHHPSTYLEECGNLLETAIACDDLDKALYPVMTALGITTGDVAAQHFSGYEPDANTVWAQSDGMTRRDMLADYIRTECVWAVR